MDFNLFWYNLKINKWWLKKSYWGNYTSFWNYNSDKVVINLNIFYELYKKNPDIRQSINKISLSVAKNWIILKDSKLNIIDEPLAKVKVLRIFSEPTFLAFKKEFFKQYLISWEAYIISTRSIDWTNNWTQILDSRTMIKRYDTSWNIIWFTQNSWTNTQEFTREEVCYFRFEKDVDNENNWMWLLYWVIWDALSDLQSSKRNYKFFENDAVPNAMLLLDEALSDDEMKNAKSQFEREYKWTNNSHKMLIAWWVKDIKILSTTHKDMDFINQKKLTVEKIAAAFWVPKSILWYVDNVNLSNGKEMKNEYIEWTIRPFEKDFWYVMNSVYQKFFNNSWNIIIIPDWESTEDKQLIEDNQRKDVTLWLKTIDEIRIEREEEPFNTEESKRPIIQSWLIPLEDIWMTPEINTSWS